MGRRGLTVRLHVDHGEPLEVALEAVERTSLGVGDALGPRRRRQLLDADAEVRVRDAALHLLSHRARTRRELQRRLSAKGHDPDRIEACLDRLSQRGLMDDAAVSAAFVRDRLRHRPRGRGALRSELRAKGVDASIAERVISGVFEEEEVDDRALAEEVAEGWVARQAPTLLAALVASGGDPERQRAQRRLRGYLGRRGFRGDELRAGVARAEALARERTR
jgi:regulatory protein